MSNLYNEVIEHYKNISILGSIRGVLNWDTETGMVSNKGIDYRGVQFSFIGKLQHQLMNDTTFREGVLKLHSRELGDIENRNIELLYRSVLRSSSIPSDLIIKLSQQANLTNKLWKRAKTNNDYSIVMNDMRKLFELNRQRALLIGKAFDIDDPFSSLISERDAGLSKKDIGSIFSQAREYLIPMIKKLQAKHYDIDTSFFNLNFEKKTERMIVERIADYYQFFYKGEDSHGRIGEVEHPLTIACGPQDVRFTVKFGKYARSISSAQHEIGHALHRLNMNPDWNFEPINNMGFPSISEMASRYTENKIGKSVSFWRYFYPILKDITGHKLDAIDMNQFYYAFTKVNPNWSRMTADEVSYGIHIIIRFEIESGLFADTINFNELPQVWREKYDKYLGVDVETDTQGVLQDLHWYNYYWGYFQGYFLGDLFGSQVHYSMINKNPDWQIELENGDMTGINSYFIENVYHKGALYDPLDMIEKITKKPFSVNFHKKYLEDKYFQGKQDE